MDNRLIFLSFRRVNQANVPMLVTAFQPGRHQPTSTHVPGQGADSESEAVTVV